MGYSRRPDVPAPERRAHLPGSVSGARRPDGFPLAGPLPSTASATGRPAWFGGFSGTTGPSVPAPGRVAPVNSRVDHDRDHVPDDHRSRNNQQAIVDPGDLKDAHDSRHPRIHPCARAPLEHGEQVRQSGEGGSEARDKTDYLRPVKWGDEQARRVVVAETCTSLERNHARQENAEWHSVDPSLAHLGISLPSSNAVFVQGHFPNDGRELILPNSHLASLTTRAPGRRDISKAPSRRTDRHPASRPRSGRRLLPTGNLRDAMSFLSAHPTAPERGPGRHPARDG